MHLKGLLHVVTLSRVLSVSAKVMNLDLGFSFYVLILLLFEFLSRHILSIHVLSIWHLLGGLLLLTHLHLSELLEVVDCLLVLLVVGIHFDLE